MDNLDTSIIETKCNENNELSNFKKNIDDFLQKINTSCSNYLSDEEKKQIEEEIDTNVQCKKIINRGLQTFRIWKNDVKLLKSKEFFIKKLNIVHGQHLSKEMKQCLDDSIKESWNKNTINTTLNGILEQLGNVIKDLQKESNDVKKCKDLAKSLITLLIKWNKSKLQLEKYNIDILSKCIITLNSYVIITPTIASYYHKMLMGIIKTRKANNKLLNKHIVSLENIINSST